MSACGAAQGARLRHFRLGSNRGARQRGTQSYRLAISDGGKPLRELQYKTTKALTATYPELTDRVPSKFRRASLPIPSGLHEISVALVKPKNGSVEIHARIPEPDVGNAE